MKKYLVTGCAGFIGSNLVEALLASDPECTVFGVDNLSSGKEANMRTFLWSPRFRFFQRNISHLRWYAEIPTNIDCVFHLASLADVLPSLEKPTPYFEASVVGTHNVLEWMRINGIRDIVYSASSSCYGDAQVLPTPENAPISFLAPYALYKWMGERECEYYAKEYNLRCFSLRYFNVYGKRVKTTGFYGIVVGIFLAQHFQGHPLSRIGTGEAGRDFIDVRDVCRLNIWASERCRRNAARSVFIPINVGTGKITTINQLIQYVNGGRDVMDLPARSNEAMYTQADNRELLEMLEMSDSKFEFITVEEGVKYLLENEQEYFRTVDFPKYV